MDVEEIRARVKQSIARITGIDPKDIADAASYQNDLALDSLSTLEHTIDVEYLFKIKVPEEQLQQIRTVEDTVRLVHQYLAVQAA